MNPATEAVSDNSTIPALQESGVALVRNVIWLLLLALCGCGSPDALELARVCGSVTYQGKLLHHGRVVFNLENGSAGPQAVGVIDASGFFEMQTGAGRARHWESTSLPSTAARNPMHRRATT